MSVAKMMSASVRPLQASHLGFETDGVLGELNTELGASVKAFDFAAFYALLGSMPEVSSDPSRLLYDSLKIQGAVKPYTLAALRSEPRKTTLNKAINARQNAFFAKYGNIAIIVGQMYNYYSPSVVDSKPSRLQNLSNLAQQQADQLKAAYTGAGRLGVVKQTESELRSSTSSFGTSGQTVDTASATATALGTSGPYTLSPPPVGGNITVSSGTLTDDSEGETQTVGITTSTGGASEYQTIFNTDYGYRMPFLESQAQNERAQVSLIDERFAQFMYGQNLPNLTQVLQNESRNIDDDVYRLQIAFLNTILMSPIAGTITGIYKSPGDTVRAGETVVRVEDSGVILILATLVFRGPIAIGSNVQIQTQLFDASGPPTTVTGKVVALRGRQDDEQWDVIVQCNNLDGSGNPIFPLGYQFDYDDTTVSIT